ncbi:hypothetical protein LRS06_14380 [Hymenobacter sp. J193]|uniref:hypothetical protein n=1 Tax=Hymenobacter sp. J193 TaxID=2898429 RepID=UPI0021516B44|nr:hypothetical protein [Hymenobacter sp. J193]MCR5888932.1 hypothetical protein [Hymenobacter sp. J193]
MSQGCEQPPRGLGLGWFGNGSGRRAPGRVQLAGQRQRVGAGQQGRRSLWSLGFT